MRYPSFPSKTFGGVVLATALLVGTASGQPGPPRTSTAISVDDRPLYGPYLITDDRRPVYVFALDHKGPSQCYGACASSWPPVTTDDMPRSLSPLLLADRLGTVQREDGALQVTYAGWPLYFYAGDRTGSESTGQGAYSFCGGWHLLGPDGRPVAPAATVHAEPPS